MSCDGSPGNPGVETIPTIEGPDKVACLGCSVCKPMTNLHEQVERTLMTVEEMERITTSEAKTPEEIAKVMGVPVENLAAIFTQQLALYSEMAQRLAEQFAPPALPNREQRRAMARGKSSTRANKTMPKGWGK